MAWVFDHTSHCLAIPHLCATLTPAPPLGRTDYTLKVLWLDWCPDPSTVVLSGHRRWPAQVMHALMPGILAGSSLSIPWISLGPGFYMNLKWPPIPVISVLFPTPRIVHFKNQENVNLGDLFPVLWNTSPVLFFEIPKWLWGIKIVIWPYSFLSCIKLKSVNYTIGFNLKYMPRTKDSFFLHLKLISLISLLKGLWKCCAFSANNWHCDSPLSLLFNMIFCVSSPFNLPLLLLQASLHSRVRLIFLDDAFCVLLLSLFLLSALSK